jgi:hypothetical protein
VNVSLEYIVALLLFVASASSQEWKREEKTDPLRGTKYVEFSLQGRYLTPPKNAASDSRPTMVVRCNPGLHMRGHTKGTFQEGYIFVGGVVDSHVSTGGNTSVHVQLRLDDGKLQDAFWHHSTDYSSIFFSSAFIGSGWEEFANLLYGHKTYHKDNTNPQVRKVVMGVPEFLGGEVVMQFDMPEATEVADACGIISHKQKQQENP